jgi:hypothetical protein
MSALQWLAARRPRGRYARLREELAAVREDLAEAQSGLDVLGLGVIDADLNGSRANARVDQVFDVMRELAEEVRSDRAEPAYEISEHEERDAAVMPHGHPESLVNELDPADEKAFIALCCTEFTAEDWRERHDGSAS